MGSQRHDEQPDDFEEHDTVADAYSPPVPPSKATTSKFMIGVLALVALCLVVFVVALLFR